MSGGGDTPTQNTYWAFEFESGKFVLGSFNDEDIFIECETDSVDLWVVDAEGVIIDNIAMHSGLESDVVDAVNAKYKTNFSELTMKQVTDIAIGEDCPNWNAYEKIEMELIGFYKYDISGGSEAAFNAMEVVNGTVKVYATSLEDGDNLIVYDKYGNFTSSSSYKKFLGEIAAIAQKYSNYKGIERVIKETTNISNWQEYTLLKS